ncbi:MAG: SDR family NAD(P)-dependent oxidoreductase [Spirochaetaceae bacterium]|nr:SDR family NAD(P)-dependent oxidoreductase [Spirochaetaceae bacterium]MCF7950845.1 SDR family NAD(P)-dependent oxidoreductase [Spirochaetaceae bacterium]
MKLHGKTALITGGAKGIGYATALRLADAGCSMMLWDIDETALEEAQAELSVRAALRPTPTVIHTDTCDVSDPEAVAVCAHSARKALGRIDILINNAGYMAPGYFTEQDLAAWHRTIDINLNAVLSVTHAFLPDMYRRNFGRVVNISSAAGLVGVPGLAVYSAAKWAVFGLTESLRAEARALGKDVRYSSIHPMFLASGMFAGAELNFFGKMLFPRVSGHDVIAKAIVLDALKRGARCPKRPRRLRLVPLLRGLLPDTALSALGRLMGLHRSMDGWTGRTVPSKEHHNAV